MAGAAAHPVFFYGREGDRSGVQGEGERERLGSMLLSTITRRLPREETLCLRSE